MDRRKRKLSILECDNPKKILSERELEELALKIGESSDEEPFQDSGSEYKPSDDSDQYYSSEREENSNESDSSDSDLSENGDVNGDANSDVVWNDCTYTKQPNLAFTSQEEINVPFDRSTAKPIDFYQLFISDDIIELMVRETNKNAQTFLENNTVRRSSRYKEWKDTNVQEMKMFLGLRIWMRLVNMPSIESYWSDKRIYKNEMSSFITRNCFQLLLRFWHFGEDIQGDRLCKIRPLLELEAQTKFQQVKTPGQNLVIDESMVPLTGRLNFKQYIPGKSHKYGIKLFKICDQVGYTHRIIPYCGKKNENDLGHGCLATNVVMSLMTPYLGHGRILCTDNFYTSVPLIEELSDQKTYFVGTYRKNRKVFPKEVTTAKLKRGECKSLESSKGVVALKWRDKRDVYCVSSKFSANMVPTGKKTKRKRILKSQR
ncbi:hypothetical protein NQ314_011553 [Rhamnusium bicolor]|uniref:PiggyBac transposable element-derived protein domain-containing protein n=1 Tax=Rhamnusium bicolor TaxID=1586634 RepID=A0AAV8XIF9_9CUCU|nr:hypothetical protein NQ314_011553 [Rhamnusium bicolor]